MYMNKERHFAAPLKETRNFWIRRFGIRENML